jgi:hypothetical protein
MSAQAWLFWAVVGMMLGIAATVLLVALRPPLDLISGSSAGVERRAVSSRGQPPATFYISNSPAGWRFPISEGICRACSINASIPADQLKTRLEDPRKEGTS